MEVYSVVASFLHTLSSFISFLHRQKVQIFKKCYFLQKLWNCLKQNKAPCALTKGLVSVSLSPGHQKVKERALLGPSTMSKISPESLA